MTDEPKPPTLYEIDHGRASRLCRCGARIRMSRTPAGAWVPLSVDSPLAEKDEGGVVMRAPSHFTDCPNASEFSKRRTRGS